MFSHEYIDSRRIGIRVMSVAGQGDRFTPRIKVGLQIEWTPPQDVVVNAMRPQPQLTILEHRLEVNAGGYLLGSAGPQYDRLQPNNSTQSIYDISVPRNVLLSIELTRRDDLQVWFNLGGICIETNPVAGTQTPRAFPFSIQTVKDFSQAQWTKLLRETGFQDIWVVEVAKPQIPPTGGLDKAQKFLTDAETEIMGGSPENAVANCRKALDVLEPFLGEHWKDISEEIDRGSIPESNHPAKSVRVSNIRDSVRDWSNIGPHADKYPVSLEDARLCYRLTVTLFSYISKIATRPTT